MFLFDFDRWQEIFANIRKNTLRTVLTAFGIFWGIFLLIVTLGVGNGLQNGVKGQFAGDAVNQIWVWSWKTSKSYKGLQPGRQIRLTEEDYDVLKSNLPGLEDISAVNNLNGEFTINYGDRSASFQIRAIHPHYGITENLKLTNGRFLNEADLKEKRPVCVLGRIAVENLFSDPDFNPVGKQIYIKGYPFQVIGTFRDPGGEGEMRRAYIPFTTYQQYYSKDNTVENMSLTLKPGLSAQEVEDKTRQLLSARHNVSPEDKSAIGLWAAEEEYKKITGLFQMINIFIWFVGLGTLIAGVVGVGNIMLITVKDRTREIGIRKALGATPFWVVSFIMQEAVFITTVSGYLGIVAGVGVIELARYFKLESDFFKDPEVDLNIAIIAVVILVAGGALAGLFPATKAAQIQPIEALRYE